MKFAPTVDFVFEPAISMSVRGALTPDYDQDFGATMRDRAAMKQETLVQHHPPTPPDASELQSGLQQVAQYNADGSYSYNDPQAYGGAYTSAVQTVPNGFPHHMSHTGAHPSESFGLDISYDGYSPSPDNEYYSEGQYHGIGDVKSINNESPLTPRSTTDNDDAQRGTRNSRIVPSSSSLLDDDKPKSKAMPKTRKSKVGRAEKPKTPKLTAPLSILTKGLTHIPVKNMEEWVNRSVETRRKEVERRNGYVTRPMNSFMLYRSAYADRTKQWCLQNNHQVVSSVSGESWPLEPPEIRELYNEYAKIERINHHNAHPTYKFSPSKTATPARKRKGEYSDDEPSDLDDSEWIPSHNRSRLRSSRRPERALSYHIGGIHGDAFDRVFGPNGHDVNKSSWEMANEGRAIPMQISQSDLYNQYFQNSMQPNMNMFGMEDLRLQRVDTPGASMQFSPEHAILGLPGGNVADLMEQMQSQTSTPLGEHQVDPMLLAYDGSQPHSFGATLQHPEFQHTNLSVLDRDFDQHSVDPHSVENLLTAGHGNDPTFHPGAWQPEPHMAHLEPESEFEKWVGDQ